MTLEDHAGDVLGKARAAAGVSIETAARAAGILVAALAEFESSGRVPDGLDFQAVAALVVLDAAKWERVAQGWLPVCPDLSLWRCLELIETRGGGYTSNAWLVWDETSREAVLFDAGFETSLILKCIEKNGVRPGHVFITHSHHDHVGGLDAIKWKFPRIQVHSNHPGEVVSMGPLRVRSVATPGHTSDGVTYIVENGPGNAPAAAFVGDTLFAGSMGRGNYSWPLAKQTVREQILTLPPETLLCPGHGPVTTVGQERKNNPFF